METEQTETAFAAETYAVVEVMGHDRIAGRISKEAFGGAAFLRVDVPALPEEPATERTRPAQQVYDYDLQRYVTITGRYVRPFIPARAGFTKLFGANAIFSMRLCSAEDAFADEMSRRERPSEELVVDSREPAALPAPGETLDRDPFSDDDLNNDEEGEQ